MCWIKFFWALPPNYLVFLLKADLTLNSCQKKMKTINVTFKHSTVDRLSDGRVLVCFDHMCSQVLNTKCQINFWINLAQRLGGNGNNFSFRETAGLMVQVYLICCVFV